ncbi:MAG: MBL fold metallo-hydrolase [Flavobacteriaceae bacterium]|nr:MBL fold metallo-hydrolase [Flavobacteriaceae bacterium]
MEDFEITFKWVGAATWVLTIDGVKIGCDPVLCKKGTVQDHRYFRAKRRTEPKFEAADFEGIDFWLLTHAHEDHIDVHGLGVIAPDTKIYAHPNLKKWLRWIYPTDVDYIKPGMRRRFNKGGLTLTIEAVPCVHASNAIAAVLAGGVNGYWLTVEKEGAAVQLYITGDTIDHQKVRTFVKGRKADILIPNIGGGGLDKFGGPYTFTASQMMTFSKVVDPALILPVHHTSFSLYKEPISVLDSWNDLRIQRFSEGATLTFHKASA